MYDFPPSFELIGEIKAVDKREPTETKRTPAMKMFIQYGPRRAGDGKKDVNFVNGMYLRVPFFVWQRIAEKLVPGAVVHIKGHLQGVYKPATEAVTPELVAERISFARVEGAPGETVATPADDTTPAAAG